MLAFWLALPSYASALDDEVAVILPYVEKETGKKLAHTPSVHASTPFATQAALTDEFASHYLHIFGMTAENAHDLGYASAEAMFPFLVGKYGLQAQTLFVRPKLAHLLAANSAHRATAMQVLDCVLAHELTHAIQDQEVGLSHFYDRAATLEQVNARAALIEGHAVVVARAVAHDRGLDDPDAFVAEFAGVSEDATKRSFPYGWGSRFVAARAPTPEDAWALLAHPPVSTAEIFDPSRYGYPPEPPDDRPDLWAAAQTALGATGWPTNHLDTGELDLRNALDDADVGLAAHLRGGRTWAATDGHATVDLRIWWFDSPQAAHDALDARAKAHRGAMADKASTSAIPVTSRASTLEGLDATNVRFDDTIAPQYGGYQPVTTTQVLALHGMRLVDLRIAAFPEQNGLLDAVKATLAP